MTYGTSLSDGKVTHDLPAGSGYFILTPEENDRFKRGEVVEKLSADSTGPFRIGVYLGRSVPREQPVLTQDMAARVLTMLTPDAKKMLNIVIDAHPNRISIREIAKLFGCSKYAVSPRMKNVDVTCDKVLGTKELWTRRGPPHHVITEEREGNNTYYQATDELVAASKVDRTPSFQEAMKDQWPQWPS